ncbi:alkaline phosphatase PhoX [Catellatospora coxensis]
MLRLVYQCPAVDGLDFPDNITTSPNGTLILCEDGANNNYVRGLTRHGEVLDIALNRLTNRAGVSRERDEFAGCAFSPDGHTLFVNVLAIHGMTIAIWGPWAKLGI